MPPWRTFPDTPSQRLRIHLVAGGGDARNTQDNVGGNDAEHNDLNHVHEPCLPLASTLNQRLRRRITPAVLLPLPVTSHEPRPAATHACTRRLKLLREGLLVRRLSSTGGV